MKNPSLYSVVTTIQPPTPAVRHLVRMLARHSGHLIIVGDRKGPSDYHLPGSELLTLKQQLSLPLRLPSLLPVNHYVRKNVGYLVAIGRRAPCIFETDDDNAPMRNWRPRTSTVKAIFARRPSWCNVFAYFTDVLIWPRGFPLEQIGASCRNLPANRSVLRPIASPIQQVLADGNPDVDAIWRFILPATVRFSAKPPLALLRGVWCPFNSQGTWWWPEAYPLMYLPSHCTFRMTDIWRSFIAQRCVWELGNAVTFHAPEVFQRRNPHNLLRDFEDEVPGYLQNGKICGTLSKLNLRQGRRAVPENLLTCYEALVQKGFFPSMEMELVKTWLQDLARIAPD